MGKKNRSNVIQNRINKSIKMLGMLPFASERRFKIISEAKLLRDEMYAIGQRRRNAGPVTHEEIVIEVIRLRGEYNVEGFAPEDINMGDCRNFAEELHLRLGKTDEVKIVDDDVHFLERFYSHTFIYFDGRYYDSEAPSGVRNWFHLPIFDDSHYARHPEERYRVNVEAIRPGVVGWVLFKNDVKQAEGRLFPRDQRGYRANARRLRIMLEDAMTNVCGTYAENAIYDGPPLDVDAMVGPADTAPPVCNAYIPASESGAEMRITASLQPHIDLVTANAKDVAPRSNEGTP